MKTIIFLVLLLQSISAQQDSLLKLNLDQTASELQKPVEKIETFFSRFFTQLSGTVTSAASIDTINTYYFDVIFNPYPEYNHSAKSININFNYIVADKRCNNSNRNGLLLLESIERISAVRKEPEKMNKKAFILVPDKCTTTRFYNAKKEMICDNKKQFSMEYEEGKKIAGNLKVRIGIQLLSTSSGDYYEKITPVETNYPVESNVKEYVLRCCIRSITFLNGSEILDSFVSLK